MTGKPINETRAVLAWGGFCDGKLHCEQLDNGFPAPAVFAYHADARKCYEDVRRVEIKEIPRGRRK